MDGGRGVDAAEVMDEAVRVGVFRPLAYACQLSPIHRGSGSSPKTRMREGCPYLGDLSFLGWHTWERSPKRRSTLLQQRNI